MKKYINLTYEGQNKILKSDQKLNKNQIKWKHRDNKIRRGVIGEGKEIEVKERGPILQK